ncbi:MAG TPA: hypothetical protein VHZ24_18190 [Pirellulales bacterium]|jgi:hypothetical protein|nr:hypothetical protein [Pirellulales bacterium]
MNVWRKQTTKRGDNGVVLSKRFYGTLRLASGRAQQVPLVEDRDASKTLLRRLQSEQDEYRSFGRSAAFVRERQRPLLELVDEFEGFLALEAVTNLVGDS